VFVCMCVVSVVVLCETSKLCMQIPIESTLLSFLSDRKNKGCDLNAKRRIMETQIFHHTKI